jgi:hypothetical protein
MYVCVCACMCVHVQVCVYSETKRERKKSFTIASHIDARNEIRFKYCKYGEAETIRGRRSKSPVIEFFFLMKL